MKNKTKHTPGPWARDGFNLTSIISSEKPYRIIADCRYMEDRVDELNKERKISVDEAMANSKLIVAAPKLLYLAKMVVQNSVKDVDGFYPAGLDDLRAAIEEAEGGE